MAIKNIHPEVARKVLGKALTHKVFVDRAFEMILHSVSPRPGHVGTLSDLKANKDWPVKGSISYTRDGDGKKIKLILRGKKFKVLVI